MAERVVVKSTGRTPWWDAGTTDGDIAEMIVHEAANRFTFPLDSLCDEAHRRLDAINKRDMAPATREEVDALLGILEDLPIIIEDLAITVAVRMTTNMGAARGSFEDILQRTAATIWPTAEAADEVVRNTIGLRAEDYAKVFPGFTLASLHVGEAVKLAAATTPA